MDTFDAGLARAWVRASAAAVEANVERLTDLDTAIGDGDHGANMRRGLAAAVEALDFAESGSAVKPVLARTGTTLVSRVGGASGPLYGTVFRSAATHLDTVAAGPGEVAAALEAALEGVCRLGGARVGDKTMVDALSPAVEAFAAAARDGAGLADASRAAAAAAAQGVTDTAPLRARKGRASYLGERSIGHEDPGATSTALVLDALAATTADRAG